MKSYKFSQVEQNRLGVTIHFPNHRKIHWLTFRTPQHECLSLRIRYATTDSGQLSLVLVLVLTFNYTLIPLFVGCVLVLLPFALFQIWCYLVSNCIIILVTLHYLFNCVPVLLYILFCIFSEVLK